MEKLLEKMVEGKINNKNIVGVRYNSRVLWSNYYVEYTISPSIANPSEPLNTIDIFDDSKYSYLPEIDNYELDSPLYYEDIRIILKDGSEVNDITTPVNSIEKIIIFYNTNTYKISFNKSRIKNLLKINTSNLTSMSQMFRSCVYLENFNISNFDTSKVTNMYCMFRECTSLKSIDLSNWKVGKVTDMIGLFYDCSSLTSLDLSNFGTAYKLTTIRDMFRGCTSLASLKLSGFYPNNVTDMSSVFYDCTSLTSLSLSGWWAYDVTTMNSMFYNCTSLKSVSFAYSIDTSNVTSMSYMFQHCKSLTSLDLSNFNTSKVTGMDMMFYNCKSLTSLDVSNFNTSKATGKYMFKYIPSSCKIYVSDEFTLTESQTNFSGTFTEK